MTRLAALALLMLAGCGYSGPGEMTSEDVDNIAESYALEADADLEQRIEDLEGRLDDLEVGDDQQARDIEAIHDLDQEQADVANDNDGKLDRRIRAIEDRLRM